MRARVIVDEPIEAEAHIDTSELAVALAALARRLEDAGERAPTLARATIRVDVARAFTALRAVDGSGGMGAAADAVRALADAFEALR